MSTEIDFRNYLILGACSPPLAHQALETEDKIGVLLPCNVVVQETAAGVEVAAMDPVAAMGARPATNYPSHESRHGITIRPRANSTGSQT